MQHGSRLQHSSASSGHELLVQTSRHGYNSPRIRKADVEGVLHDSTMVHVWLFMVFGHVT